MTDIISPFQSEDGLVLTPTQKEERHRGKVEAFKTGLRELEEKTGMTLMITLRYLPNGIFPAGTIMELPPKPTLNVKETKTA